MPRLRKRAKRFARRQTTRPHTGPIHSRRAALRGRRMGRPGIRRRRRIIRHRQAAIFLLAGAAAAVKVSNADVERIQHATGKSAEELTDHELLAAMERLGIEPLDLDRNDQSAMKMPKLAAQCPSCGYPLTVERAHWAGPMSAKCPACNTGLEIQWVAVDIPTSDQKTG